MKEKLVKMIDETLHTQLPAALARLRFQRIALGVIVLIITIMAAIVMKTIGVISFLIIAIAFALSGLKISYDYIKGNITEHSLICLTITQKKNGTFSIVFEDDNKETQVFLHNSKKEEFLVDVRYRFYTSKSNPKLIIAYEQI